MCASGALADTRSTELAEFTFTDFSMFYAGILHRVLVSLTVGSPLVLRQAETRTARHVTAERDKPHALLALAALRENALFLSDWFRTSCLTGSNPDTFGR